MQAKLLMWRSHLKREGHCKQVGWGISGNVQDRRNNVSQYYVEHRFGALMCRAGWVGAERNQRAVAHVSTSLPGESGLDSCPSSPHHEVGQFSYSWYVSSTV